MSSCDYYLINSYDKPIGHLDLHKTNAGFKTCLDEVHLPSYYSRKPVEYLHGKDSLQRYFHLNYDNKGITNQSGYITFRFIINCEGTLGNFEIHELGIDYKEKKFQESLVVHLQELLLQLNEWKAFSRGDSTFDSFHFITFKIDNGELVDILP